MSNINHILVYGTLRRGQHAHRAFGLDHKCEYVDTVRIEGSMYNLGSFPGVKLDGNPDGVVCEVYRVNDSEVMDRLDAYEGFREDDRMNSLYWREAIELADLPEIGAAYIYEYNREVGDRPRMESGDWINP